MAAQNTISGETRLFGTDGIRGKAGEFPLDQKTVEKIGSSLAVLFQKKLGRRPGFVIGRDTRESGGWLEAAFCEGAESFGAVCASAGILTTPGVAFLAQCGFDAGIVISASHNPFYDNGIKIFSPSGKKIDDTTEREIEGDIFFGMESEGGAEYQTEEVAAAIREPYELQAELQAKYEDHFFNLFPTLELDGIRLTVDCANGAASAIAPKLFRSFGASVDLINASPDGRNINKNCGSLYLDVLQNRVRETGADIGVAFDGDADRALFIDEKAGIVDGDAVLWILANSLMRHGKLLNKKVVATVMSNMGLELALRGIGIDLLRTSVGDKYVLDELLRTGSELGGEQSGHIIITKNGLVGDGLMTALMVLQAMKADSRPLSEFAAGFEKYPQILVNVPVLEKHPFDQVPAIAEAVKTAEAELAGSGRLLLRYSGTEKLARIMIEGRDQGQIEKMAAEIADVIREALG